MKIAYVVINNTENFYESGVGKKILSQMKYWEDAGHKARLFITCRKPIIGENISSFSITSKLDFPLIKNIERELSRYIALTKLIQDVEKYCPDVIYYRYSIYTYPLHKLFLIAPCIGEINTLDVTEFRSRGIFRSFYNKLTRNIILKNSAGFVCISHEISQHSSIIKYKKPTAVISNGINLDEYHSLPASSNTQPRLLFMAAHNLGWHGVDKLISLAINFPDLFIDIVGLTADDFPNELKPSNIIFHGYLPKDEYIKIVLNSDVGIGTLALHRKNMEEASPLKVREYLAYGLPIIIAYEDSDFIDEKSEFILRISNKEDNVALYANQIHDFAYQMIGKRVSRDLLLNRIDQINKEIERIRFMQNLLSKS